MHELSLCGAIIDTATAKARGRAVRRIDVRIGHLRQVVPETLQFCWTMRTEGTAFAGCELAITHVPARVVCRDCAATTVLEHPVLRCDTCGETAVDLVAGEELLVVSMELAPDEDNRAAGDGPALTGEEAR